MQPNAMIIDSELPAFDVTIAEHVVVGADPDTTLSAARALDFTTIRTPLVIAAMWARGLPDRIRNRRPEPARRMILGEGDGLPGWVMLGSSDTEIAFGAVGRFWKSSIEWHDVAPDLFAGFADPGWGKIACNFSVRPYGSTRTLLSYECRTTTTDPESRRKFANYWFAIKPFVGHIMRATLRTIAESAERGAIAVSEPVATGHDSAGPVSKPQDSAESVR